VSEADETSSKSGRARWWLAGAALHALVPMIPIIAGLIIGSASVRAETVSGNSYLPVAPTPPAPTPHATKHAHQSGAVVAVLKRPTTMRTRPGGPRLAAVGVKTQFGSPQALWVASRPAGSA
jgi:hypothetical protein